MPFPLKLEPLYEAKGVLNLLPHCQGVAQDSADGKPFAAEPEFAGTEQQHQHGHPQKNRHQLAARPKRDEPHHQKNQSDAVKCQHRSPARQTCVEQMMMEMPAIRTENRQPAQATPKNGQADIDDWQRKNEQRRSQGGDDGSFLGAGQGESPYLKTEKISASVS